ncbi:MAG: GNAT family N-acetyltransferase [Phycisphaerales bacterium]|nr:GNAT family N-acetyltransferase [Phycisphaerales bacterium]
MGDANRANPARAPLLSGARVHIRHPVDADRAEIAALRRASREWLARWDPLPPGGVELDKDAQADRIVSSADTQTNQRHLVCEVESGRIVGVVSLNQICRGPFDNAIMGYWRGEGFGGRGLMTEGVRLVLKRAFEGLGLHRVEANLMPRNAASRALAVRCGFRYEGYSPNYLQIAGRWEGHERYAMTREDWRQVREAEESVRRP